jgi:hypothetical protein
VPASRLIVVEIIGGLGNQMFQYAAATTLACRLGAALRLDVGGFADYPLRRFELGEWRVPVEIATADEVRLARRDDLPRRLVRRLARLARRPVCDVYVEPSFHCDDSFFDLRPPIWLRGYFQSPRYFAGNEDAIRRGFTLRDELSSDAAALSAAIAATPMPVSLHVRRGDYVTNAHTKSVHDSVDVAYYRRAIEIIDALTAGAAHYFIFSDDPDYVRATYGELRRHTVIDGSGRRPHEDMILMSQCRHNVIANSSFSWWGAWLNANPDRRVVAPRAWSTRPHLIKISLADLHPEGWILA